MLSQTETMTGTTTHADVQSTEKQSDTIGSTVSFTSADSASTTNVVVVPNWRLLKCRQEQQHQHQQHQPVNHAESTNKQSEHLHDSSNNNNNTTDFLQLHGTWSIAAYQQALQLYQQLMTCQDPYVKGPIQDALHCLDQAYRLYGPISVVCSFNGGKDAVVILHLMRAAHAHYYDSLHQQQQQQQQQHVVARKGQSSSSSNGAIQAVGGDDNNNDDDNNENDNDNDVVRITMVRPRVVYFEHADEFPEILSFLHDTVHHFDLEMIAFERGIKFVQGLSILVNHHHYHCVVQTTTLLSSSATAMAATSNNDPSHVQPPTTTTRTIPLPLAFVLGTRSTDPNAGSQGYFAPSSSFMPPFMRVNPVLHWTYGDVWHFLRLFHLPYCCLYDQGYTSLGTVKDTIPCPALAVPGRTNNNYRNDESSVPKYWPAYMLRDWDQERAGRIPRTELKGSKALKALTRSTVTRSTPPSRKASALSSCDGGGEGQNNVDGSHHTTTSSTSMGNLSSIFSEAKATQMPTATQPSQHHADHLVEDEISESSSIVSASAVSFGSGDDVVQKSVGLLVIGDEILKGLTADKNTLAAAKALRDQNVLLKRVVVVSDEQDVIVREIHRLQQEVDVIITSGGVGPTHDDVTIKSVAAALACEMALHEEMAQLLLDKMNTTVSNATSTAVVAADTTSSNSVARTGDEDATTGSASPRSWESLLSLAQMKMATLPKRAKLRYLSHNPHDWPVLQCQNIFILPGIPEFFAKKIVNVAQYLSCQLEISSSYKVVLSVDESSIVSILNDVVENHPLVSIGSYPFVSQSAFKTVLTIEGRLVTDGRRNSRIFDLSIIEGIRRGRKKNVTTTTTTATTTTTTQGIVDNEPIDDRTLKIAENATNVQYTAGAAMHRAVQLALDELIHALPPGSVLRVDKNDLSFS